MSDVTADFEELRRRIFKDGSREGFLRALDGISEFVNDLRREILGDNSANVDTDEPDELRKEAGESNVQTPDPVRNVPDMIKDAMVTVAKESQETSLGVLGLSVVTRTALYTEYVKGIGHINSVERLERLTDEQLTDIYGIGKARFDEIKRALAEYRSRVTETPIEELGLKVLVTNALLDGGVRFIEHLEELTDEQLRSIDGIGLIRIAQIRAALEEYYATAR